MLKNQYNKRSNNVNIMSLAVLPALILSLSGRTEQPFLDRTEEKLKEQRTLHTNLLAETHEKKEA